MAPSSRSSAIFASPKSSSFAPLLVIMMLAGFEIPVQDALAVRGFERVHDVECGAEGSSSGSGPRTGDPSRYSMTR